MPVTCTLQNESFLKESRCSTCFPHFQSIPLMTRAPTPSIMYLVDLVAAAPIELMAAAATEDTVDAAKDVLAAAAAAAADCPGSLEAAEGVGTDRSFVVEADGGSNTVDVPAAGVLETVDPDEATELSTLVLPPPPVAMDMAGMDEDEEGGLLGKALFPPETSPVGAAGSMIAGNRENLVQITDPAGIPFLQQLISL